MLEKFRTYWPAITSALLALGLVYTADPVLAAVSVAGTLLITLLNFLARSFKIRIGAEWLSLLLYGVATVLAVFLEPVTLPAFPTFPSDPVTYAQALADFIARTAPLAGSITASATLLYNALKSAVWDKVLPVLEQISEPYGETVK